MKMVPRPFRETGTSPASRFSFWFAAGLGSAVLILAAIPLLLLPFAQLATGPSARHSLRAAPSDALVLAHVGAEPAESIPEPAQNVSGNVPRQARLSAGGPIAQLQERLASGELQLASDSRHGYLLGLLKALDISPSSQILVFSKTASAKKYISPKTPRAIYFNDRVAVGWIPGSPNLEIAATDPTLGVAFFTVPQENRTSATFVRNDRCVECHSSAHTMDVPGFLVRSVTTDTDGNPDLPSFNRYVSHGTPLQERWGGWYVCGTHGNQAHLGNLVGAEDLQQHSASPGFRGNLTDLSPMVDLQAYPERTSDIVALLVFEHQCHMQNLISRLRHEFTRANPQVGTVSELPQIRSVVEEFLKYLLFVREAPLTAPVRGVSEFSGWFQNKGLRDSQGRSLRDLELETRLFKYPCSYLIYSEDFESLPRPLKLHVYSRLWKVLRGEDEDPEFQKITPERRGAILQILTETKRDLPAYWTL